MKAFIALCFLAVAAAEADPALIYRTAGVYGLNPYTNAFGYSAVSPYYNRAVVGSPLGYRLIKREAEAEAEADPALIYGNAGLIGASPYINTFGYSSVSPYYNRAIVGSPLGYRLIKREAEAEAEADPALLYANAGLFGVSPYAANIYSAWKQPLNYAALPAYQGGYAAAGKYVANSAGVVHVAKREAEAEADPALLYSAGYTTGYTAGYPLRTLATYPAVHNVYSTFGGRILY